MLPSLLIAQTSLPPGGEPLLPKDPLPAFRLTTTEGNADAVVFTVSGTAGPGFAHALHIETKRDLSPSWAAEVRTPLSRAVEKDDVALVRFYARSLESADETGAGMLRVTVQLASGDYSKAIDTSMTVGREWQEFLVPFAFHRRFAKAEAEISFGFGFKRQTIEIGGVEVVHYGKKLDISALPKTRLTYEGREPDALWRQAALARIEKMRMSNFVIDVRDSAGQSVGGATIRVEQVRSAFQFGTAIPLARLVQDSPDNAIYREKVLQLFNSASPENALKWPIWEGDQAPRYDHGQTLAGLRWMKEHNLRARGHVLVWPGWHNLPASIRKLHEAKKDAKIQERVLAHIREITGATRGLLEEWDVVNEPYDNHDLMALFGAGVMVDWFKAAEIGAPGAVLYLNDYSNHDVLLDRAHCENFFRTTKFLIDKGAPLGGLGLQAHIAAQPNSPEAVLGTLDLYATFKLPIRFTEFDIDTDDEELQADYTRDFLILAYSHPSVVGVQHWGFWEGAHWRPKSAMFRRDWSEKPSAMVYEDLVLKQWRTRLQGTLGASGKGGGRGYHGDYVVVVEHDGQRAEKTFTLRPEEPKTTVQVTLP